MKLIILIVTSFLITSSFAFKLSPMTQELILEGKARKSLFTIINDGDKPIAIQAEMTKRVMDKYGRETNPSVDEEFLIFPDQLIIKAGEKRAIQITWLGKKDVSVEQAYRFIAEQLPVNVAQKKSKKSNIKILLKYRAAFYLTPKEGKSSIGLEKKKALVSGGKIEFSLVNNGNRHEILKDYDLKISGKKGSKTLAFSKLKGVFGENILAKQSRRFKISLPREFKEAESLSLDLIKK